VILLQTSDQKLCKYQTTILLRQQKCLYHHNGSFYANSPELINKKHYDQSQTISMMMIRLIYNLLTKAASIHISFQRMLSLQAQQHHNHIYKPVTQASGSSGSQRCKKSLQRWTNTKSGKSSLDHPICASWEHVGYILERLMEKPANHRHTKLWLAKGFSQIEGIDFNELFAAVAHKATLFQQGI